MSHIALLLPDLDAGGAQQVMLMLAGGFIRRGHRVDLLVLRSGGVLKDSIPTGVALVDLDAWIPRLGQPGLLLLGVYRLRQWLLRRRPAVLLSTISGANLLAALTVTAFALPVRLVLREANALASVTSPVRRRAMSGLYRRADAVVALSRYMADELELRLGVSRQRLHCIPNPVDAGRLRVLAQAPLSHPWLDDAAVSVIITAGRLVCEKDHETLIRAFAMLPSKREIRLIILGDGPLRGSLDALVRSLGLDGRVLLAGFDRNPWRWLARADIFVLSSQSEGSPNALLEAIVLGLPAVTTAFDNSVTELAEINGVCVAPVADPKGLAQCMAAVLQHDVPPGRHDFFEVDIAVRAYLSAMGVGCAEGMASGSAASSS